MRAAIVIVILGLAGAGIWLLAAAPEAPSESTADMDLLNQADGQTGLSGRKGAGASADPSAREEAKGTPRENAEALLAALRGKSAEAQAAILQQIQGHPLAPIPGLVTLLTEGLSSGVDGLREQAAWRLRLMGCGAVPALVPLVRSEDEAVRFDALNAIDLCRMNGGECPALDFLTLIGDESQRIRSLAFSLLSGGTPYDPTLAARLAEIVLELDGEQFGAAMALAAMGGKGIEKLLSLLPGADAQLRRAVWRGLVAAPQGDISTFSPQLAEALLDPDSAVRAFAVKILGGLEGPLSAEAAWGSCVTGLVHVLGQDDERAALESMEILAGLGPAGAAAIPDLIDYLRHPNERVVAAALKVLGQVGLAEDTVVPALQAFILKEGSDAAAEALAQFGPRGREAALEILREGAPAAREAALLVFAEQGADAAAVVPEIAALIGGEDVFLNARAVFVVGSIGPAAAEAAPAILASITRPQTDGDDMRSAGWALRQFGPAVEPGVRAALRSPDQNTRRNVLGALIHGFEGGLGFCLPEIFVLAGSKEEDDRIMANEAMISALQYPDGFAKTPPGVDDRELRERVRALLVEWTSGRAKDCEHLAMLAALDAPR